jgi:hypothetical protein
VDQPRGDNRVLILCIFGSRSVRNQHAADWAIINGLAELGFTGHGTITYALDGGAPGADRAGRNWCKMVGVRVEHRPAAWNDLTAPGARIWRNKFGKLFNANAGYDRNEQMAEEATHFIALWDGESGGTQDMISRVNSKKKPLSVQLITLD